MNNKFAHLSLAALTAATLALPAAAAEPSSSTDMTKPVAKHEMMKCGAHHNMKCGAHKKDKHQKHAMKCGAKCGAKGGAKCGAKEMTK